MANEATHLTGRIRMVAGVLDDGSVFVRVEALETGEGISLVLDPDTALGMADGIRTAAQEALAGADLPSGDMAEQAQRYLNSVRNNSNGGQS